jgi:predicted nucleic acid-binding Zn ribbon protein
MPLYDIQCSKSGITFERMIPLANFEEPIICACHAPAKRLISRPLISVDNTGYNCPVTGKWVGSRREHRDNLARQGCRVLEPGEKDLNSKRREQEEAAFERKIEDTVERTIESYPSAKKEQLHNELVNGGLDVAVERR